MEAEEAEREEAASPEVPIDGYLSRSIVVEPNPMDILCGRGKSISAHPGNVRFRDMIVARREEYQHAKKRDDKSRITEEIVDSLQGGTEPSR